MVRFKVTGQQTRPMLTMTGSAVAPSGVSKTFRQIVSLCTADTRMNLNSIFRDWINCFSTALHVMLDGRLETSQHQWGEETYNRIRANYWLSEEVPDRSTWCDRGGRTGIEFPVRLKLLHLRSSVDCIALEWFRLGGDMVIQLSIPCAP